MSNEAVNMNTVRSIVDTLPTFNEDVCRGWAVKDLEDDLEWLDRNFKCISKDYPGSLEYHYIEPVTPEEEYQQITRFPDKRCIYDICESDTYMARIKFTFEGEDLLRHVNIPFVRPGGIFWLRGSESTLIPVVGDRIFSASETGIFVIINRSKFKLNKDNWRVLIDEVPTNLLLVDARLFNGDTIDKRDKKNYPEMLTTTGHYLFAFSGVRKTFRECYGADIKICYGHEINEQGVNLDDWAVIRSTRIKPEKVRRRDYVATNIVMLIRREDLERNESINILIASFFYAIDYYPETFTVEDIDEPVFWRLTLAYAIHNSGNNEGKLITAVDKHLESLERYVDAEATQLFVEDEGVNIRTFYEMINYFNNIIEERTTNVDFGSQWGKFLMIKRYVLAPFTKAMVMIGFNLTKSSSGPLRSRRVVKEIGSQLLPTTYLQILKEHGEKVNVQYPGDCMLFKHTCNSVRQVHAVTKGDSGSSINPNDVTYSLHACILECGSIMNFSKRYLDGRAKLNPYIHTNDQGRIVRNPKFIEILDQVQDEITGKNLR